MYNHINDAIKDLIPGPKRCQNFIYNKYINGTRWYHGDNHILDVLNKSIEFFNDHQFDVERQLLIKVALLCHDLIYDVPNFDSCSNEQKSAMAFVKIGNQCDWPVKNSAQFIMDVAKLIRYTEYNNPLIVETYAESHLKEEHGIIHDIDFSAMGADYINFVIDGDNIRNEYWQFDDEAFDLGRMAFLKSILTGNIYLTEYYQNKYEERAKANIRRFIQEKEKENGS